MARAARAMFSFRYGAIRLRALDAIRYDARLIRLLSDCFDQDGGIGSPSRRGVGLRRAYLGRQARGMHCRTPLGVHPWPG
eukprot:8987466-Lingulodinium_polyedra.AAC.1